MRASSATLVLVLPVRAVVSSVTKLGLVETFSAATLVILVTCPSCAGPLVVIPGVVLLQAPQCAHIILEQDTLPLPGTVIHSSADKIFSVDTKSETGLEVPVCPRLHLLVHQSHESLLNKLVVVVLAGGQRRFICSIRAIAFPVTDVATENAFSLPETRKSK